jgi:branched-chain amino acid transport system permease protein
MVKILRILIRHRVIEFILLGIAILVILPFVLPEYGVRILTTVIIMALFATSLNMEMGYAGMMPLGQSMFLGLGAYSFAILLLKVNLSFPIAIVVSLLLCLVVNAIIGYLCLRGNPLTFGLLHLSFNILFGVIVAKWISVTHGDGGIINLKRPGIFANNIEFYLLVLGIVLICYLIIYIILRSPFGKIAQGLRENEERLIFLGINTKRYQLTLFIISGFFAGVSGILLALFNQGVFPSYTSLVQSAQVMMMCLIGGSFTFLGPTLGSVLVVGFSNVASNYLMYWQGMLGFIMVAAVLGFRGGILRKGRSLTRVAIPVQKRKVRDGMDNTSSPEGTAQ